MKTPSNSVKELRRHYAEMLSELYGKEEANTLIMMMLEHHFGFNRVTLALNPNLCLNDIDRSEFESSMKELLANRPIQYVIGTADFCNMKFLVNENVLIPRPETEELVYLISSTVNCQLSTDTIEVLDIGTGSGCIAVSLAKLLNNSQVSAIDISEKALDVAKANASANAKIEFIHADILSNPTLPHKFDVIVSNPPYICESEKAEMRRNVLDFEPTAALFVDDNDPLIFYKQIIKTANDYLKPDGTLWFEINEHLGNETLQLCVDNGFSDSTLIKDFMGKERFIKARKNPKTHEAF